MACAARAAISGAVLSAHSPPGSPRALSPAPSFALTEYTVQPGSPGPRAASPLLRQVSGSFQVERRAASPAPGQAFSPFWKSGSFSQGHCQGAPVRVASPSRSISTDVMDVAADLPTVAVRPTNATPQALPCSPRPLSPGPGRQPSGPSGAPGRPFSPFWSGSDVGYPQARSARAVSPRGSAGATAAALVADIMQGPSKREGSPDPKLLAELARSSGPWKGSAPTLLQQTAPMVSQAVPPRRQRSGDIFWKPPPEAAVAVETAAFHTTACASGKARPALSSARISPGPRR